MKSNRFRALLALSLLLPGATQAADVFWTGSAGDGLWGTASNWSSLALPDSGDDVFNLTAESITLDGIYQGVSSLTTSGSLTLSNNSALYFYSSPLSMAAGTTLTLQNSAIDHYLAYGSPATSLSSISLVMDNGRFQGGPGGMSLASTVSVSGKNADLSTYDLAFSNATTLGSREGGSWNIGNTVYGNVTAVTNSGTIGSYGNLTSESSELRLNAQYLNNTGVIEAAADSAVGLGGYASTYVKIAGFDSARTSLGTIRAVGDHAQLSLETTTSVGHAVPTSQLSQVSATEGGTLAFTGVIDNSGASFSSSNYKDSASTVLLRDLTIRGGTFLGSQGGASGTLALEGVHVAGHIGVGSSENINLIIDDATTFAPGTTVKIGYNGDLQIYNFTAPYTLDGITLVSDSANVRAVGSLSLGTAFVLQGRYTSFGAESLTNAADTDFRDASFSAVTIRNQGAILSDGHGYSGSDGSNVYLSGYSDYAASKIINESGATLGAVNGGRLHFESANVENYGTITVGEGSQLRLAGNGPTDGTTLTQSAGRITINGTLEADNEYASLVLNGGTLNGSGTILASVVQNGGVIAPGNSPGTLTINGNFTQNAGGTLVMEVASQSTYDKLILAGASNSILGTLQLQFVGGYTPSVGDTFDFFVDSLGQPIMTNFSQVVLPSGYSGNFGGSGFVFTSVAAPEPSVSVFLLLGLGFVRRKR